MATLLHLYFMISFCLMNLAGFVPPQNPCAELNMLLPNLEYTILEDPLHKVGLKLENGNVFIGEGKCLRNAKNNAALQCLQSTFNQYLQIEKPKRRKKKPRDFDQVPIATENWDQMMESWVKTLGKKRKIEETSCEVSNDFIPLIKS